MDINGREDIFRVCIPGKTCVVLDKSVAIREIFSVWMTNGLIGQAWLSREHLIQNL
jgi:hypothetical protein